MKYLILLLLVVSQVFNSYSQRLSPDKAIDFTLTAGQSQAASAFSYRQLYGVGKSKKFLVGAGLRLTGYTGTKKEFLTAGPARYTRTFTAPFAIVFAGQREENFDTLTVQRPLAFSANLAVYLGYRISKKWEAGFNIDVIGFTVGRSSSAILTSNGSSVTVPSSKLSSFNLLLTGDHDKGSLNSEFYLSYQLADRWALRGIYQFVFIEYRSGNARQTFSDGRTNSIFRNKANMLGVGVTYSLK
jgi:hypothetical protein